MSKGLLWALLLVLVSVCCPGSVSMEKRTLMSSPACVGTWFAALALSAWRTFMSSPAGVGTCLLPWLSLPGGLLWAPLLVMVPVCCPGSLCLEDFYELPCWWWYLFAALALSAWKTFMSSPAGVGTCLLPWLSLPGGRRWGSARSVSPAPPAGTGTPPPGSAANLEKQVNSVPDYKKLLSKAPFQAKYEPRSRKNKNPVPEKMYRVPDKIETPFQTKDKLCSRPKLNSIPNEKIPSYRLKNPSQIKVNFTLHAAHWCYTLYHIYSSVK